MRLAMTLFAAVASPCSPSTFRCSSAHLLALPTTIPGGGFGPPASVIVRAPVLHPQCARRVLFNLWDPSQGKHRHTHRGPTNSRFVLDSFATAPLTSGIGLVGLTCRFAYSCRSIHSVVRAEAKGEAIDWPRPLASRNSVPDFISQSTTVFPSPLL